jgi:hypothetical protein
MHPEWIPSELLRCHSSNKATSIVVHAAAPPKQSFSFVPTQPHCHTASEQQQLELLSQRFGERLYSWKKESWSLALVREVGEGWEGRAFLPEPNLF